MSPNIGSDPKMMEDEDEDVPNMTQDKEEDNQHCSLPRTGPIAATKENKHGDELPEEHPRPDGDAAETFEAHPKGTDIV